MCRVGRDVLRRLRRHARARAGQLRCVLDKPAEFQNTCKIIFGRNMRPDTEQESRQAMSVIKLYYL